MTFGRFEVKATRTNGKLVFRHFFENREEALDMVEELHLDHPNANVEFKDHQPFAR